MGISLIGALIQGSYYEDTQEMEPQFIETAMVGTWNKVLLQVTPHALPQLSKKKCK